MTAMGFFFGGSTWTPTFETNLWQYNPINASAITFATPAITNAGYRSISGTIASHAAASGNAGLVLISARTHWCAGPGGYGRCATMNATDGLKSNLAASAYNFLHSLVSSYTLLIPIQLGSRAVTRTVLNTKATAGTGNGLGVSLQISTTGVLTYSIGTGSSQQSFSSSSIMTETVGSYILAVRYNVSTNAISWQIFNSAGASIDSGGATVTITPSASDAGQTLQICPVWFGQFAPPVIWKSYLNSLTLPVDWALRYIRGYSSPTEMLSNEPHVYTGVYTWASGAIVTHLGATPTTSDAPTIADDATILSKQSALFNGTSEGYSVTGNQVGAGTDLPCGFSAFVKWQDSALSKTIASFDLSSDTAWRLAYISSGEIPRFWVEDNSATSAFLDLGAAAQNNWFFYGAENLGTSGTVFGQLGTGFYSTDTASINVGTSTFDQASIGYSRQAGVASGWFKGYMAYVTMCAGGAHNAAFMFEEMRMLKTYFGTL